MQNSRCDQWIENAHCPGRSRQPSMFLLHSFIFIVAFVTHIPKLVFFAKSWQSRFERNSSHHLRNQRWPQLLAGTLFKVPRRMMTPGLPDIQGNQLGPNSVVMGTPKNTLWKSQSLYWSKSMLETPMEKQEQC